VSDLSAPGVVISAIEPVGLEITLPSVTLGATVGITYGLLAVGLVLVYRSNRIINFAHGELYMAGAYAVVYLYADGLLPLPLAAKA
jgi:branched-subunit amino acid ABC-type transport system permease component